MPSTFEAVFLVKTPLQYLNALEALEAYGLSASQVFLLLMADRKSLPQLIALVDDALNWGAVQTLSGAALRRNYAAAQPAAIGRPGSGRFNNSLFLISRLASLALSLGQLKVVAMGDLGNPLMRHFANKASCARVVVLDDGAASIDYARQRNDHSMIKVKPTKAIKLFLKRALLGLRDHQLPAIEFFSVYDLATTPPDRYVKNDYKRLRNQLQKVDSDERVFFLGGPLVEAEILSEPEYALQLSAVSQQLGQRKILYVVHRRENLAKVRAICRQLGWEYCLFDFPIEYQMVAGGERPSLLASFYSSALPNCRLIFGATLKIHAYRLDPQNFAKKGSEVGRRIDAVYKEYKELENSHFEVIDL